MTKIKVTVDPSRGIIEESVADGGEGVDIMPSALPQNIQPHGMPTTTINASKTLPSSAAGIYVLSASDGSKVITVTMPTATASMGKACIFRVASLDAHVITGSAEDSMKAAYTDGTTQGQGITFPAIIGSSAMMTSDGHNWLITSNSGTLAFSA